MSSKPKIASASTTEELLETYKSLDQLRCSGLVLNRVTDLAGRIEVDGSSIGLSSKADQALMKAIRANADAVLIGGNTLRSEIYRPDSSGLTNKILVILTRGQDVEMVSEYENVVVLSESVEIDNFRGQWFTKASWTPEAIISQLTDLGLKRTVCEAGPQLSNQLFAANSFVELYITISPRLGSGASHKSLPYDREYELFYSISGPGSFLFTKWRKPTHQMQ